MFASVIEYQIQFPSHSHRNNVGISIGMSLEKFSAKKLVTQTNIPVDQIVLLAMIPTKFLQYPTKKSPPIPIHGYSHSHGNPAIQAIY